MTKGKPALTFIFMILFVWSSAVLASSLEEQMKNLRVNSLRLEQRIAALAEFGKNAHGGLDRVAFSVTQTTGAQSVSGTVSDGVLPVGGALVVLLPINEDCDAREYTAFTDAAGNYSLELAAGLACEQRVVLSARPGYVGGFLGQPSLQFTGSDAFVGVDLTLSAGDWMVDGAVKYEDGPRVGQGIPGAFVFADGDDGFSVGFSDGDGGYDFMLTDGNWSIEVDEATGLALQGAVYVDNRGVGVSVSGGPALASDMLYPAANAFISGTLFDDGSTATIDGSTVNSTGGAVSVDAFADNTIEAFGQAVGVSAGGAGSTGAITA